MLSAAPVQESPTIYSVFLQENQKDKTSEKDSESAPRSSSSTGSVTSVSTAAGKKNIPSLNKKAAEKKKDVQFTLEDALQQVVDGLVLLYRNFSYRCNIYTIIFKLQFVLKVAFKLSRVSVNG